MGGVIEIPGIDLGQEIGRGGGGRVVAGRHRTLDRAVAVKLIDTADDPDVVERFLAECRSAATLSERPGIVPIHDAGTVGATAYIVMPYYAGGTLRERLRLGPLPTEHLVAVVTGIGEGLAAAHEIGLVHRDVKPENILIGSDGRPALADFGVAALWSATAGLTAAKDFSGTVAYTAPERLAGLKASPKADQFALAVVAWEGLTGAHPYMSPGDEMPQVIARLLDTNPPDASMLPPDVAAVLTRALSADPAVRYPDVGAFVDELTAALGVAGTPFDVDASDHAVTVVPTTRRRRLLPLVAAATVVVLAGGMGAWAIAGRSAPQPGELDATATPQTTQTAESAQDTSERPAADGTVEGVRGTTVTTGDEEAVPTTIVGAVEADSGVTPAPEVGTGGLPSGPGIDPTPEAPVASSTTSTTAPSVTNTTQAPATTSTTKAPTTTTTTQATTTTTKPPVAGAVSGFTVSSPQVVSGSCTTSPCQVQVSLSWNAASGVVDNYTVRAARYWFGANCDASAQLLSDPVTWTVTGRSAVVTTANANAPCGWVRWEIWANNASGAGPLAVGVGVVPNVVGEAAGIGAAEIQTIGAYVGWETPDPGCGAAATICTQDRAAGTVVANGSVVRLKQPE